MVSKKKLKNLRYKVKRKGSRMEKVKDLILYQVATDRNYKVGDKIYFGEKPNGQIKIFDFSFNKQGKPLHELGFKTAKKGIFKNKQLQLDMAIALQNYDLFMREIALEEVRQEKFPELPSRFRCMYLSESKEDVFKNLDIMANKALNKTYQAVAVKLNGEIFCVRDFSIGRPGLSFNEYKKLAEKYWSQDQNSTTKAKEILFVGEAEIVEILKEVRK